MVYKSINHGNDVTCHAVLVILFLVSRKKKKTTTTNVIVKNKSTTIFHGPHSYLLSTFYDVIAMVYKSADHGKLMRFVKWTGGLPHLPGVPPPLCKQALKCNTALIQEIAFCLFINYAQVISMHLRNTTYARNNSLEYHHVV